MTGQLDEARTQIDMAAHILAYASTRTRRVAENDLAHQSAAADASIAEATLHLQQAGTMVYQQAAVPLAEMARVITQLYATEQLYRATLQELTDAFAAAETQVRNIVV